MKLVGRVLSELIIDNLQVSTYDTLFYEILDKGCDIVALYTDIRGVTDRPRPEFLKSYHPTFQEKIIWR